MVRWGLIGASDIAETRMILAINGLDDSEVVAVASSATRTRRRICAAKWHPETV